MAYQPIENYGIIGDLHTVALVGKNGSIDFMCYPDFDSPTLFAAMLDDEKGGRFSIAPQLNHVRYKQLYLPDTNVLLTRFLSPDGVAEISDYMPIEETGDPAHDLVRRAKTVRGEIRFQMECSPRFDYARAEHEIEKTARGVIFRSLGPDRTVVRLFTDVPVEIRDRDAVAEFTLGEGETAFFVLEEVSPGRPSCGDSERFVPESFKRTVNYWRQWSARSSYRGRWREMVKRSALTLKLLFSTMHGSLVAAPTFGLPEVLGGERNWDYRYTWIRDASFTLYALIRLGYTEETGHFMAWIEDRCREIGEDGSLQTLYSLDGAHHLAESSLTHLEGYRRSLPVRVGNAAADQLQLDIYGELMDSVYLYDKYGQPISYDFWQNLVKLLGWLENHWQQPDEGIWEVRGGRQHFLYSRVLCWVAFDRAIRLARKRSLPGPVAKWKRIRDRIYHDVFTNFWSERRRAFIQALGWESMDAGALIMPLVRFVSPTDPRWLSTLARIEEDLVDDSLVFRYREEEAPPDGLTGLEGTFNICSFWYVECLSRAGDLDKARFYFEKALGYANHVGLYSEELGPSGEHLGNFPQAFTHLALISAAYDLDRRLSRAGRD